MAISLALACVELATVIAKIINTDVARLYVTKLYSLKQDLLDEMSKGYFSDDAKIENLYQQIKITTEAVQNEYNLHITQPN